VHRQVPQAQPPTPVPSTGVDYLGLVLAAHHLVYLANPSIERRLRRHAGRSRTLVLECLPAAIALPRGRIVEVLGPESLAASEPAHRGGAVPQRGLRRAASDPCCPQCTSDLDWAAQRTPLRTGQRPRLSRSAHSAPHRSASAADPHAVDSWLPHWDSSHPPREVPPILRSIGHWQLK
jgi:hypothetical protein